jgi:ADP-heptose:LPS heptosyltransferase
LIGLHPGGRHPTQRWGAERFARLAGRLSELGSRPVVLGGGPDAGDVDRIRRLAPVEVPHLETDADAKSLARALAGLDLLVCNNSGPLHLASLIGVPTVSTMGPTRPELWWPAGHRARVLRRDELDCIGCNSGRCRMPSHLCMDLITVDDVLGAVSESLGLS